MKSKTITTCSDTGKGSEDSTVGVQCQINRIRLRRIENESLHTQSNDNSEKLTSSAPAPNMEIRGTRFLHKCIHKGTWTSQNGKTNQIDRILIVY